MVSKYPQYLLQYMELQQRLQNLKVKSLLMSLINFLVYFKTQQRLQDTIYPLTSILLKPRFSDVGDLIF